MPKNDLTGMRSGKLEVIKFLYTDNTRHNVWLCKCDCGKSKEVRGDLIKTQRVTSCGCSKGKKREFCKICNLPIPADSKYKDFCGDECKKIATQKSIKKSYQKKKYKGYGAIMKGKKAGITPLDKVLADLRAYNEKNGTHLSYGQYVHMVESGANNKKSSSA